MQQSYRTRSELLNTILRVLVTWDVRMFARFLCQPRYARSELLRSTIGSLAAAPAAVAVIPAYVERRGRAARR